MGFLPLDMLQAEFFTFPKPIPPLQILPICFQEPVISSTIQNGLNYKDIYYFI